MSKISCSVGILTLNSAKTLRQCLESVKDFAEIIICDGNSTDETLDIAREYGCKIIKQYETDEPNIKIKDFSEVRNKCVSAASFDWFLYIDADAYISDKLREEIREITQKDNPEYLIYQLPSKIIYEGRVIEHASGYPGYQIRFFNKKTGAFFVKPVHERVQYDQEKYKVGTLEGCWLLPETKESLITSWQKYKKYIQQEVERSRGQNFWQFLRWSILDKIIRMIKVVLKASWMYFRYGFKDSNPPLAEFQRFCYQATLLYELIKDRLKKRVCRA